MNPSNPSQSGDSMPISPTMTSIPSARSTKRTTPIGNPVKNTPLFRQDLAAPYGSAGEFDKFEDITNGSYTMNLDMTGVATPQGRKFLQQWGGMVSVEVFNEYRRS